MLVIQWLGGDCNRCLCAIRERGTQFIRAEPRVNGVAVVTDGTRRNDGIVFAVVNGLYLIVHRLFIIYRAIFARNGI